MKKFLYMLAVAIAVASCAPQKVLNRKIGRAEAYAHKHGLVIQDTIIVRDTIITERSSKDTIFSVKEFFERSKDTIVIKENNLRVKIHSVRDTISISGECLPDTIYYEKMVPVDKIIHQEISWWDKYKGLIFFLFTVVAVVIVVKREIKQLR
jgi:hypothetical protein